jgi:16S rRNA (cytosine967-C5)-methyltransferase
VSDGIASRRLAIDALLRIEDGAYANLVLGGLLGRSTMASRDRALVTDLVYGTTRMRRACDWLVDRHLSHDPPPVARAALRLGAYQLAVLGVAPHAAVATTVGAVPRRYRGVVNAVLRRVAAELPVEWPSAAVALSYPDWLIETLCTDLGEADAMDALAQMNEPATVTERADGYIQDRASQWVVEIVAAAPGERVVDLCAAPGGKATGLAATGATVVAADIAPGRAGLVAANAARLTGHVGVVVADARRAPFPARSFDRVLLDAPCSGLGVLRRRPDARWRLDPDAIERLAALQRELLVAAAELVRPGGRLVYSVCTLTTAETLGVVPAVLAGFEPVPLPAERWRPLGTGGRVLPQDAGTDGMTVFAWDRPR